MTPASRWRHAVLLVAALSVPGCGSHMDNTPKGNPVAVNCGITNSPGNELGVGKYCTATSDCPAVQSGTSLQCSTVLVEPSFPLICSRLCDPMAADPGCGTEAVCKNLTELGLNLTVCVPKTCQPLFSEPL
jgi:hypothetical protein